MIADDTLILMAFSGIEKAHVAGLSLGGMIARELAINYAHRVMKLVLASTYARQDETSGDTVELARFSQLTPQQKFTAIVGLAFNKPIYRFIFALLARIQTRFMGASHRVGIEGQSEACRLHDTLDRLPLITAPAPVILGTGDSVNKPVSSEVIASKIPHARLIKVQGGSHYFSLEMKKVFNREVLNFLCSTGSVATCRRTWSPVTPSAFLPPTKSVIITPLPGESSSKGGVLGQRNDELFICKLLPS